jgi:MFS family permease
MPPPAPRLHYAWTIAATGTLCVFAGLGLGRFALGMLLPSMASSLAFDYSQIGWVGTGNFVGYLAAVLVCGPLSARLGPRRLVVAALLLMAATMLLISRSRSFAPILILYTLTGFGSGAVNVPVMGLVARWFASAIRGRASGFVVIGSGFAIILSGWLIPFVNRRAGAEGWRVSWALLAAAILLVAGVAGTLLRDRPEDVGLSVLGRTHPAPPTLEPRPPSPHFSSFRSGAVWLLGVIYWLFGFTYVIYVTFFVTSLVKERGFSEAIAGSFWSVIGFLSLFSGPVFGTLSDRLGRRAGLAIVFSLQALAYLLVALPLPPIALHLSIFCFGVVAWSIPSIMLAAVSDQVGPEHALSAFGFITFVFGVGQIAGPAVAGALAERTGSFRASFGLAAALAALAILLTTRLRRPAGHHG